MRTRRVIRCTAVVLLLALAGGACGSKTVTSAPTTAPPPSTTEATTTTTTPDDGGGGLGSDQGDAIEEFESQVRDDIGLGAGSTTSDGYATYVTVEDDSGLLSVDVPAEWADVDGGEGLFGPDVIASTDVAQFQADFNVPGVEFQATSVNNDRQGPADVLGRLTEGFVSLCTPGQISPYVDPLYNGVSQIFTDCNGTATSFVWVAVQPLDDAFTAIVGVQIVDDRDVDALGKILDTFIVRNG